MLRFFEISHYQWNTAGVIGLISLAGHSRHVPVSPTGCCGIFMAVACQAKTIHGLRTVAVCMHPLIWWVVVSSLSSTQNSTQQVEDLLCGFASSYSIVCGISLRLGQIGRIQVVTYI